MQTEALRGYLHSLHSSQSSVERQAADAWLRGFACREGAWQQLLSLLADPAVGEHGSFFAATALLHACQRQALDPATLAALAPLLAQQLAAATAARCWHTRNQLAAALATAAVRSPAWPEASVLPQLLGLAQAALADSETASSGEHRQLTLLRLLTALAECLVSNVSMHPQRREALRAALAAAPEPLAAVQQAAGPGASPAVQAAAVQLLHAWCGLGWPPATAEGGGALWQRLYGAALRPELGGAAAEALAALYSTCLASGDAQRDGEQQRRRHQLLSTLLGGLPGFAAELQTALAQAREQARQAQLLFAALTVLGAAAAAVDGQPGAVPAAAAAEAAQLAADVALAALQHPHFGVTLAALQFWDDQLERWQAQAGGACGLQQRQALVGRLCGALLQRMAVPAGVPAAACTADARDLPGAVLRVRRETADTFRAATDFLGPASTRRQLLQLAAEAAAAGEPLQQECCLYALNIVWARQRARQPVQEAAEEVQAAAAAVAAALQPAAPKLAGTALTLLGGMAEQLALLLEHRGRTDQQQGQQQGGGELLGTLLDRVAGLVRAGGDLKLSRNAATCCHRLTGSRPLAAALVARYPGWGDALCGCFAAADGMQERARQGEDLSTAQLLLVSICRLAAAAPRSAQGASGPLRRLLSQPAAAADAALAGAEAEPRGSEGHARQLMRAAVQVEAVAVALEAVAARGGGACTTLASASDGADNPGVVPLLPELLAGFGGVLGRAAAAAAACGASLHHAGDTRQARDDRQPLLQAVCRLAAAVAATPAAGVGLRLLRPLAAAPAHPCVLQALTRLAEANSGGAAEQQLQQAAAGALQAAAAQHGGDPDWQPAILALGQACLLRLPAVAADGATLDALLATAQQGMRSYHREACERATAFAEALCCVGCPRKLRGAPPAAPPPHPARQALRQRLDAGLGSRLVLGLLLAAAGSMPPYMMVQLADALHRTWLAVGTDGFGGWLREAALQLAPDGEAPWRRWKPEAQTAAVQDLLAPQCAQDARRFKRLLKVFCGGKKSGRHVDQPARSGA